MEETDKQQPTEETDKQQPTIEDRLAKLEAAQSAKLASDPKLEALIAKCEKAGIRLDPEPAAE